MLTIKKLKKIWHRNDKFIYLFLIPILSSIVPIVFQNKQSNCAFVLLIMSFYWITDCLPIGVTSIIPVFLFPIFGIMTSKDVSKEYYQDIIFLLFGGLVMANAIELSGLHEKSSIKFLMLFGSNPKWLLLGFMLITGFISLWINNSASCSMMLPIIESVVNQLIIHNEKYHNSNNGEKLEKLIDSSKVELIEIETQENLSRIDYKTNTLFVPDKMSVNNKSQASNLSEAADPKISEKGRKLYTGFLLACSYSASIGGFGSLVGTTPNVILKGFLDETYPGIRVNFLNFLLFAFPISLIMIILSWMILTLFWLPKEYVCCCSKQEKKNIAIELVLREKYESLPPTNWEQFSVAILFFTLIILWITRDFLGLFGWGYLFNKRYVTDTTPAIMIVLALFACPKKNIFKGHHYEHLISWKKLQEIFPWNVLFLIGGGLAIAKGFQESELSKTLSQSLVSMISFRKEVVLVFVILLSTISTEFTSNISISTILIPIVNSLTMELKISPLYLMLPLIISVSFALMLPVATPTNAIIFSHGHIRIKDMMFTGIFIKIVGIITVFFAANTWLGLIFDLSYMPKSLITNSTLAVLNRTVS